MCGLCLLTFVHMFIFFFFAFFFFSFLQLQATCLVCDLSTPLKKIKTFFLLFPRFFRVLLQYTPLSITELLNWNCIKKYIYYTVANFKLKSKVILGNNQKKKRQRKKVIKFCNVRVAFFPAFSIHKVSECMQCV